jgi:8-amino-7-oxononanoate synthase
MAEELRKQGLYVTAVRPPTVPAGTARLRFSISRWHSKADLGQATQVLLELLQGVAKKER